MKRRILPLALVAALFVAAAAAAQCIEPAGGRLAKGYLLAEATMRPLALEFARSVPEGYLFLVQRKEGYYYKMCDQAAGIAEFEGKWMKGAWVLVKDGVPLEFAIAAMKGRFGTFRLKTNAGRWTLWAEGAAPVGDPAGK